MAHFLLVIDSEELLIIFQLSFMYFFELENRIQDSCLRRKKAFTAGP